MTGINSLAISETMATQLFGNPPERKRWEICKMGWQVFDYYPN